MLTIGHTVASLIVIIVIHFTLCYSDSIKYTGHHELTYCGPVTPYGDMDLVQHYLMQWLVHRLSWHQTITWTNANFLFIEWTFLEQVSKLLFCIRKLLLPHLPGANELTDTFRYLVVGIR